MADDNKNGTIIPFNMKSKVIPEKPLRGCVGRTGRTNDFGTFSPRRKIGHVGPFDLFQSTGGFEITVADPISGVECRIKFEDVFRDAAEEVAAFVRSEVKREKGSEIHISPEIPKTK